MERLWRVAVTVTRKRWKSASHSRELSIPNGIPETDSPLGQPRLDLTFYLLYRKNDLLMQTGGTYLE
jgi:hypothetical protein